MGSLCSKKDESQTSLMNDKKCSFCNFQFKSVKIKKKHEKNCLYNKGENSNELGFKNTDITIYSNDPYIN